VLVCPNCRNENLEDARFCTTCGRSLAPEEAAPVRVARREASDEGIDIATPKPPSPVPGLVGLATLIVLTAGIGTWWALRPNPCEGKFSSEQFPYCVQIPAGWQQSEEVIQNTPADAFASRTFDPVVLVFAEPTEPGVETEAFADAQREAQESSGVFPGPLGQREVAGSRAMAWEFTNTVDTGEVLRYRNVVLVRDGTAWTIQFLVERDRFQNAVTQFERMLDSWAWK
jgi:hypothetical protein